MRVCACLFVVWLEILGEFPRRLTGSPLAILTVLPVIVLPVCKVPSIFSGISLVYIEQYVVPSFVIVDFLLFVPSILFWPCWPSSAPNGMEFLNLWNQVLCLHTPYNSVYSSLLFGLVRHVSNLIYVVSTSYIGSRWVFQTTLYEIALPCNKTLKHIIFLTSFLVILTPDEKVTQSV